MKNKNEIMIRKKRMKNFFRKIAVMIAYVSDVYERKKENDYVDNLSGKSTRVKTYGKI